MSNTSGDAARSDALVLFGVTDDLAHKKIFPAHYAMAKRGALNVPVVGVATSKLSPAALRERVREAIKKSGGIDDRKAFDHLLSLLGYVSGNYNAPDTFTALKAAMGDARRPAHYLAIPPALFEPVVKGLGAADLAAQGSDHEHSVFPLRQTNLHVQDRTAQ